MADTPLPIVAAFDFDNTIINRDSLAPLLKDFAGSLKASINFLKLTPCFIGFLCHLIPRQRVKEKIVSTFFGSMHISDLEGIGKQYADQYIDQWINKEAMEKLKWHQSQNHRCILVSAALDFYLRPWGKRHGFQDVICSSLQVDNKGKISGKLKELNCWGPEKSRRLSELLGPRDSYQLYAYGDSRGDKEMLDMADFPFYRSF